MSIVETTYSPLAIQGLESFEQDFGEFVIQMRKKGTILPIWEKITGGVRQNLVWRSIPIMFVETVLGVTYEVRTAVKRSGGQASIYSSWIDEVAGGDLGAPEDPTSMTFVQTGSSITASFTHTKPSDFKEYEWHVDIDNTIPAEDDNTYKTTVKDLTIVSYYVNTYYFWVRAVDVLGNRSAWLSGNILALTTDEYDDIQTQIAMNLVKNWSFENGDPSSNWTTSHSSYSGAIGQESQITPKHGSYHGQYKPIVPHGTTTAYAYKYTKLSDAIILHPGVTKYKFSCYVSVRSQNLVWPGGYTPEITFMLRTYSTLVADSGDWIEDISMGDTGQILLDADWVEVSKILAVEDLTGSPKSFRVGFKCRIPDYVDQPPAGSHYVEFYFDVVRITAGILAEGFSPFSLTEDTQSVDIAEKYIVRGRASKVGKIVTFGKPLDGKPTIRMANEKDINKPLFIVSGNFFFTLNDQSSIHKGYKSSDITLLGRVPCKVIGKFKVGDRVTVGKNGIGRLAMEDESSVGYAITEKTTPGLGMVTVFVERSYV